MYGYYSVHEKPVSTPPGIIYLSKQQPEQDTQVDMKSVWSIVYRLGNILCGPPYVSLKSASLGLWIPSELHGALLPRLQYSAHGFSLCMGLSGVP